VATQTGSLAERSEPDGSLLHRGWSESLPRLPQATTKSSIASSGDRHRRLLSGIICPPPSTWEAPYQGDLHALAIIADQDPERLTSAARELHKTLAPIAELVQVERGDRLKRVDPRAGELTLVHFGFADGISQPLTIKQDIDTEVQRRGATHWHPGAPLNLLLAADPAGGYGNYFVFRKLEQNVAGFLAAEAALAAKLGLAANPKRVEPLIVERYRDGYPPLPDKAEPDGSAGNDFNFDDDRLGAACPLSLAYS
jgi:deferrochelatase/peroxidase EfeB